MKVKKIVVLHITVEELSRAVWPLLMQYLIFCRQHPKERAFVYTSFSTGAKVSPKGKLISKCSFGIFKSTIKPTKFL